MLIVLAGEYLPTLKSPGLVPLIKLGTPFMDFNIELAKGIYNSSDAFPVDFNFAWQWLGYSTKQKAKDFLLKNFEIELDYNLQVELGSSANPRPSEDISITTEAFKTWAMMAGTEKGRQVRLYFLECERIAKIAVLESKAKPLAIAPSQKEIKTAYGVWKMVHGKAYAERWIRQMYVKYHPALVGDSALPEEKASLATAKALLTPTQIALELKLFCKTNPDAPDAKAVNRLLTELGYQEPIAGKWSATQKAIGAKLCDRKPVDTNSRTQRDQLLWSVAILDILAEHAFNLKVG